MNSAIPTTTANEQADASTDQITDRLNEQWQIADVKVPNRVMLAPLAGIGNWIVRTQAKRFGAGYAVSEMVSSFAIHYKNEKTLSDLLKFKDFEQQDGPVAIQLFGQDPDVMRSAAEYVARELPINVIDLNMGCPVPKVCKTGAGAAMLKDPDTAIAVAKAAAEGSGLPVTVKLRSSLKKEGEPDGYRLAARLVEEAGVAAIGFHPRSAQVHHKGLPDYDLAAKLVEELPVPVMLTGGLHDFESTRRAFEQVNPAAVMLARGILGDPWLFSQLTKGDSSLIGDHQVVAAELEWVIDNTTEHLGFDRASRYLRKHYPWYVDKLAAVTNSKPLKELHVAMQSASDLTEARMLFMQQAEKFAA